MREDMHTTTPEDAAAWERNHAPSHLPDVDYADDFTAEVDGCGGCGAGDCLSCAADRVFGGRSA